MPQGNLCTIFQKGWFHDDFKPEEKKKRQMRSHDVSRAMITEKSLTALWRTNWRRTGCRKP